MFLVQIENDYLLVEQRFYVHQKFDKVFVHDIFTKAKPNQRGVLGGTVYIKYPDDIRNEDLEGFEESTFQNQDR